MTPAPSHSATPVAAFTPTAKKAIRPGSLLMATPEGSWSLPVYDLMPNTTMRCEGDIDLPLPAQGRLTMAHGSEIRVGPEIRELRLIRGTMLVQAGYEPITVADDQGNSLVVESSAKLAVQSFPGRFEYSCLGGQVSTDVKAQARREFGKIMEENALLVISGKEAVYSSLLTNNSLQVPAFVFTASVADQVFETRLRPMMVSPDKAGLEMVGSHGPTSLNPLNPLGHRSTFNPSLLTHGKPSPGGELGRERRLAWRRTAGSRVLGYLVSVKKKEVVYWGAAVKGTSVRIPEYVRLDPGTYQWSVSPLVAEGVVDSSADSSFTVSKQKVGKP